MSDVEERRENEEPQSVDETHADFPSHFHPRRRFGLGLEGVITGGNDGGGRSGYPQERTCHGGGRLGGADAVAVARRPSQPVAGGFDARGRPLRRDRQSSRVDRVLEVRPADELLVIDEEHHRAGEDSLKVEDVAEELQRSWFPPFFHKWKTKILQE